MKELKRLIAAALKIPESEICDATSMETTPRWDSLGHMDLILSLEEHYKITLEGDDIAGMVSVGAIRSALLRHGVSLR